MNWKQPKVYAVKHKSEDVRMDSRSGGIFTALSDKILSEDGVVYGCILTKDFLAVHARAENVEERNKMRGSKYIQSKLGDTFKKVQEDLDAGRRVLFSGTSCTKENLPSPCLTRRCLPPQRTAGHISETSQTITGSI